VALSGRRAAQCQHIEGLPCDALEGGNDIGARRCATQYTDIEPAGIGIVPALRQYLRERGQSAFLKPSFK